LTAKALVAVGGLFPSAYGPWDMRDDMFFGHGKVQGDSVVGQSRQTRELRVSTWLKRTEQCLDWWKGSAGNISSDKGFLSEGGRTNKDK
jgi:hypothetical protein